MAAIDLHECVITQIGQPFIPVRAKSSDRSLNFAKTGSVQQYANGRYRSVTRAGLGRKVKLTLRDVLTTAVVVPSPGSVTVKYLDLLSLWTGSTVLYRDAFGNFLYCVYFSLDIKERKGTPYVDVSTEVQELTGVVGQ